MLAGLMYSMLFSTRETIPEVYSSLFSCKFGN